MVSVVRNVTPSANNISKLYLSENCNTKGNLLVKEVDRLGDNFRRHFLSKQCFGCVRHYMRRYTTRITLYAIAAVQITARSAGVFPAFHFHSVPIQYNFDKYISRSGTWNPVLLSMGAAERYLMNIKSL